PRPRSPPSTSRRTSTSEIATARGPDSAAFAEAGTVRCHARCAVVRAAGLHEYGGPRAGGVGAPVAGPARTVVEVLAAGVNPVDATISAGRFYGGRPTLPSVAGREGVGTLDGERVYFDAPVPPFGSMAECTLIDPHGTYQVPDEVDDGVAVA